MHDPLEVPVEWYVDVPSGSLTDVMNQVSIWQRKFGTRIVVVSSGEHGSSWARLCLFGKPLGIHYSIAEISKAAKCVEAGYAADAPFPVGGHIGTESDADVMPVYHAAWTEFCLNKR